MDSSSGKASVASRIKNLQRNMSPEDNNEEMYAQVNKPAAKASKPWQRDTDSDSKPKWPPAKPSVPPKTKGIDTKNSKVSVPPPPLKSSPVVSKFVCSSNVETKPASPKVPPKRNRPKKENDDDTTSQTSSVASLQKAFSKDPEKPPPKTNIVRPFVNTAVKESSPTRPLAPPPSSRNKRPQLMRDEDVCDDEYGSHSPSTPPFKPHLPLTRQLTPTLPSKSNRPRLSKICRDVDDDTSPDLSPTSTSPLNDVKVMPGNRLSGISKRDSTGSECSIRVHKTDYVAKMTTPPPMPPTQQPKLLTNTHKADTKSPPNIKPPLLPSKINRPKVPDENESDDEDMKTSLDRLGVDNSLTKKVQAFPNDMSRSVDNLDMIGHDTDSGSDVTLRSLDHHNKELSARKRLSKTLQGVKPIAALKKYISNSLDHDSSESDSGNKRRSIGDNIKLNMANIPNIFKKKDDGGSNQKRFNKTNAQSLSNESTPSGSPKIVKTPLQASRSMPNSAALSFVVQPPEEHIQESIYANVDILTRRQDEDEEDEYIYDEDDDWDDDDMVGDDNTDDEETAVQTLKKRAHSNRASDGGYQALLLERKKDIIKEMVSTETSYVNKLYLLNKTYWEVSGANMVQEMCKSSVIHHMFPSVEALYRLHGENILPAMKTTLEQWSAHHGVVSLWKQYMPFLTMYKSYTGQYDSALDTITQQRKTCPEFSNLMTKIEEKPEFGKLTLEHHLIEPVQRIARYKLLTQNYHKLLLEDDDEWIQLRDVIASMDQLLKDCQTQLRKNDTFGDMYKIQERFEDTLTLFSPTSQLIKEGPVAQVTGNTHKKKLQRQIFLFSDSVLVCTKRPSGKYRILHQMELWELKIRPVEAPCAAVYGVEKTMALSEGDTSVTLLFTSDENKAEWEEALLDAVAVKLMQGRMRRCGKTEAKDGLMEVNRQDIIGTDVSQTDRHSIRDTDDVDFTSVPQWLDDVSVATCMSCDVKFMAVVRKKYHCRGCGWVVCSSCSRQKIALPSMNGEVCRVCNSCFIRARRSFVHLTRRVSSVHRLKKFKSSHQSHGRRMSQSLGDLTVILESSCSVDSDTNQSVT